MIILDFILIITLAIMLTFWAGKNLEQNQIEKRLKTSFYQLLQSQNSCISLIQLSVKSQVEAEIAKQYLDRQVKLFEAIPQIDPDGNMFYQFPKL